MGKFNVRVNGIPFEVSDPQVESEAQAIKMVQEAALVNRTLYQDKALSLGYDFDFETQQGRERGTLSKFLIGAGESVDDTIDFIHEAFLERSGTDLAELQRFDAQQAQEEAAFEQLAQQQGVAVQAGQIAGTVAQAAGPGAGAVKGVFRLAKALSPMGWFAKAGKKALKEMSDQGVSAETVGLLGRSARGKDTLKTLSKVKNPSSKVLNQFGKKIKGEADAVINQAQSGGRTAARQGEELASNVLRPKGANPQVRQAQSRIQKELDSPKAQRELNALRTQSQRAPTAGGRAGGRQTQEVLEEALDVTSRSPSIRAGGQAARRDGPDPVLQGSDDVVEAVLRAANQRKSLTSQNDLPF